MAQQTTVRFIDDLDGSDASGTFDFSLDGRQYQIDLSDENAAKLRDALAPFVGAARKAGGRGRGRAVRPTAVADKPARSNREDTTTIREWARANGHQINDRGRIPKFGHRGLRRRELNRCSSGLSCETRGRTTSACCRRSSPTSSRHDHHGRGRRGPNSAAACHRSSGTRHRSRDLVQPRPAVFKPSLLHQGGALPAPRGPMFDAAASARAGRAACRPVPARHAAANAHRATAEFLNLRATCTDGHVVR